MTFYQTWITAAILFSSITISADSAIAQKNYDVGASDTEIKLGQTMPYSGPASALSNTGKAEAAYFAMVNAIGGVNRAAVQMLGTLYAHKGLSNRCKFSLALWLLLDCAALRVGDALEPSAHIVSLASASRE